MRKQYLKIRMKIFSFVEINEELSLKEADHFFV